jgi:hypothetical protein
MYVPSVDPTYILVYCLSVLGIKLQSCYHSTRTHTCIRQYVYMYVCVCVCVCVKQGRKLNWCSHGRWQIREHLKMTQIGLVMNLKWNRRDHFLSCSRKPIRRPSLQIVRSSYSRFTIFTPFTSVTPQRNSKWSLYFSVWRRIFKWPLCAVVWTSCIWILGKHSHRCRYIIMRFSRPKP